MSKAKHFKWPKMKEGYMNWWNGLTIDQKNEEKRLFELKRLANFKRKSPYPDMFDLTAFRASKLSEKHICRIWDFRDTKIDNHGKI